MALKRREANNPAAVALGRLGGQKGGKGRAAKLSASQRSEGTLVGVVTEPQVVAEVRNLILAARQTVARGVNAAWVMLHWKVGDRIRKDILNERRAGYGDERIVTLSRQLTLEFGRGFHKANGNIVAWKWLTVSPSVLPLSPRWLDAHRR